MNLSHIHHIVLPVVDVLVIIAATIGMVCVAKLIWMAFEHVDDAWLGRSYKKEYDASVIRFGWNDDRSGEPEHAETNGVAETY